jgi:hypothetical protein
VSDGLIMPMSEFLLSAGDEGDWVVDHQIARSAITIYAGLPKVGKSTLVYGALGPITSDDGSFLGLPTRSAEVLLLTEEPPVTVEEKVDRFEIDEARVHVLPKRRVRGRVGWLRIIDEVVRYCEAHPRIEVVVIDTIDKFADISASRSEADTGVIREMIDPLYQLLGLGVAVVLITHQRKEEGTFGLRVRGGTSLTGTADIIIEVERLSPAVGGPVSARVLKLVSRFADTPDEIAVELDGDRWVSTGTLKAAIRHWRGERIRELLTNIPATLEEIHTLTGGEMSERTLRRRLGELVDDGDAVVLGEGVKGDPWRWRLPAEFVSGRFGANSEDAQKPHNHAEEFVPTTGGLGPPTVGTNPGSSCDHDGDRDRWQPQEGA